MARIETVDLDDRHSRTQGRRVFPNPSSRSSFSLLLCDNRNIILVEKKSTAPLPAARLYACSS